MRSGVGEAARPLGPIERLTNITAVRRLIVLIVLAVAWESYARFLSNPLLFPSLGPHGTTAKNRNTAKMTRCTMP